MSNPVVQTQDYFTELLRKASEEQLNRMSHFWEEARKIETTLVQAATTTFSESAKLMADGINYAGQVSQELQKLSLQGARKGAELLSTKAKV